MVEILPIYFHSDNKEQCKQTNKHTNNADTEN